MHTQTNLLVPGGDSAVLFIHGIVGSPAHFRLVADLENAVPAGWSVVNVCLPGHGGTVSDFSHSSMKQWKAHVRKEFEVLSSGHRRIVVVGHSMGTLFALQLAAEFPDKIQQLVLLQCPLVVGLRWFGVKNLLRIPYGKIRQEDPYGAAMLVACGVAPERNIFKYIPWIPRILELFREISRTKRILPAVRTKTVAFQSCRDELVSNKSARILRKYSNIEVVEMEHSTHFYYEKEHLDRMLQCFLEICGDT